MDRLWQDIRFAARTLSRAPGLTIVAVLTLAFGIGANSAVFSLINTVLVRPLPFREPDQLALVFEMRDGYGRANPSAHEYIAWRDQNRSFDGLAMFNYSGRTLTGRGDPVTLVTETVTANFFDVLGQRPILGRTFRPGEDQPDAPRLVILGREVWSTRFGSDSAIIGKRITLDDTPYEVIGVTDSRGDMSFDLWTPMNLPAEAIKVGSHSNNVLGRLRPGVSIEMARNDVIGISRRLAVEMPTPNTGHSAGVSSLFDDMVGDVRRPLGIAFGATAFVLLIACANVGHLLLTRAAARQKELAIRTALGAGRSRIVRQLITEALLLSLVGGVLGLVLAVWATDLLPALSAVRVPRLAEMSVDWRVVAATGGLGVLSGLLCGLVPAFRASSPRLHAWLVEGNRGVAAPGRRIAGLLVVSQIALALMLLVGAGLTLKSFAKLLRIDPGFDPRNVLTARIPLPGTKYSSAERQRSSVGELIARVGALPGVKAVGGATMLPLGPCCNGMPISIEGRPDPAPGQELGARTTIVAGRYFDAMRIPLRRGRVFAGSDARVAIPLIRWYPQQPLPPRFDEPQAAPVAVISETMARRYWPNEDALGKRFRTLASPWITVIGIVGDVRQSGLLEEPIPQMYLSDLQEPSGALTLVVRTEGDPIGVAGGLRQQVRAVDPTLPIGTLETMDDVLWGSIGRPRLNAVLLGASGVIALLLAIIGVYGVISYAVERRTHEIGIRRALGAQTHDVLRMVLGQAFGLVALGIAIGVAGAFALTRLLTTLLYDVQPTDPGTFFGVAVLLAAVALLASYLPGRRATRVDPTDALRSE